MGGWLTPLPGRFTPGKETCHQFYRRLGRTQGRSGRVRKISSPPGVVSRYTDWAIPAITYTVLYSPWILNLVRITTWCGIGYKKYKIYGVSNYTGIMCNSRTVFRRFGKSILHSRSEGYEPSSDGRNSLESKRRVNWACWFVGLLKMLVLKFGSSWTVRMYWLRHSACSIFTSLSASETRLKYHFVCYFDAAVWICFPANLKVCLFVLDWRTFC